MGAGGDVNGVVGAQQAVKGLRGVYGNIQVQLNAEAFYPGNGIFYLFTGQTIGGCPRSTFRLLPATPRI